MVALLDFEKQIAVLDAQIADLRKAEEDPASAESAVNSTAEVARLEAKSAQLLEDIYGKLTPWQKAQVARHPDRPHFTHIITEIFDDWLALAGDRGFADDPAIIAGLARLRGRKVLIIGHEKGDDTAARVRHNFGMAKPEGYRKAIRLMQLADRFNIPVLSFVDTPGAFPGIDAEERGQAEAIARSIEQCLALKVPMVATIVGEGGSGGAIALAAANRVLMFEHAIYAVISPEGCASILWRTPDKAEDAAAAMKITAEDLRGLGAVDRIIPEPIGGAHRDPNRALTALGDALAEELDILAGLSQAELHSQREEKFLAMGR